ncbi:hypothetical protein [Rhodohalobacter sulfatireducens]|uniref:DUF3300 domain-containing protein n=1 Tax=Rhodohalobacter sulfatireducens TaxID=2911366 RepID=A0ABS9KAG9_9BACT|nr:hypothetical protein [Rhodohalobacter sulfatireducens]MCG2587823.1 hypothetical protein [Rhodohalobacter sulfatireducens]
MMKRLSVTLMILAFFSAPLSAQSTYVEFSYQSFRPFIHFQLNLSNSYSYYEDPYHSAYLKGYMDGVNDAYYNEYRFYDLVRDIDIYEAGYRDGYRDRDLMIRLRGIDWYYLNRFVYDDYHSPYYSVQIWLGGLSLAFLQVPERRLPRYWKRHAHPVFVKYRNWHKYRHRYNDREYRHYVHIERDYKKRLTRWRKEAHRERNRYKNQRGRDGYRTGRIERYSKVDKRQARQRIREQPKTQRQRSKTVQTSRRNRTIGNTKLNKPSERHINIQSRSDSRVDRNRDIRSNRNPKVKESQKKQINIRSRSRPNSLLDRNRDVRENQNKQINRTSNRRPETVRSNNRDGRSSKRTIRNESNRKKSRGTVQKDRGGTKSKGRSTRKGRGNNKRDN